MAISDKQDNGLPQFKVSLRSTTGRNIVVFDATPTIQESGTVQYDQLNIVHLPGTLLAYKNTNGRTFNLGEVKLVSRTPKEARKNLTRLNILRAWRMPYFGQPSKAIQQAISDQTLQNQQILNNIPEVTQNDLNTNDTVNQQRTAFLNFLGAPPDVLYLSAYSGQGGNNSYLGNINQVPVVMVSLDISYPNDVDYIPCGRVGGEDDNFGGTPFPILMTISISLQEIHSPREFQGFSIDDYRKGALAKF